MVRHGRDEAELARVAIDFVTLPEKYESKSQEQHEIIEEPKKYAGGWHS